MKLHPLLAERLPRYGLSKKDVKPLGLEYLSPKDTLSISPFHPLIQDVASVKIPYFDVRGKPVRSLGEDFFRLRYLEESKHIKTIQDNELKPGKYRQKKGTGVFAYFPPNLPEELPSWSRIIRDTSVALHITEGEFKAAKACKEGVPCVAIGGVWSWQSKPRGIGFLPELEKIDWRKRTVYLTFDSDAMENDNVSQALSALAEALLQRGAFPFIVSLPPNHEGYKVGLDDYLIEYSAKDYRDLCKNSPPYASAAALWRFADRFPIIEEQNRYMDTRASGFRFRTLTELREIARRHPQVPWGCIKNGEAKTKMVSLETRIAGWSAWPTYRDIDYMPGEGRTIERDGGRYLNLWKGWGLDPKPSPEHLDAFLRLAKHLYGENFEYVMGWYAYPFRYPGTKLRQGLCMVSREQQIGKTMFAGLICEMYGEANSAILQPQTAFGRFNEHCARKQFLVVEEMFAETAYQREAQSARLKTAITQDRIMVEGKGRDPYPLASRENWVINSNRPDALPLDMTDKRFMVVRVPDTKLKASDYNYIGNNRKAVAAAGMHFFLNDVNLDDFSPTSPPPTTFAKKAMQEANLDDYGLWLLEFLSDPEGHGWRMACDFITPKEAAFLCNMDLRLPRPATPNSMGRAMKDVGMAKAWKRDKVRYPNGTKKERGTLWVPYVLRNEDKWTGASLEAIQTHLEAAWVPLTESAYPDDTSYNVEAQL